MTALVGMTGPASASAQSTAISACGLTGLAVGQCYFDVSQSWASGMWNGSFYVGAVVKSLIPVVAVPMLVGPQVSTHLSSALSTSGPITSLPINAMAGFGGITTGTIIPSGSMMTVLSSTHHQAWTVTANVAVGATSIPVASQTPNFAYGSGTGIKGSGFSVSPQAPTDTTGAGNNPTFMTLAAVAAGTWDAMFAKTFAAAAAQRPDAILRIGWELYGNTWYPWNGAENAVAHKNAYVHLVTLARASSAQFTFEWDGGASIFGYVPWTDGAYPGDSYVDYIGADLYDDVSPFGATGWANGVASKLQAGIDFAASVGKPYCIPEFGFSSANGGDDTAWTNAAFTWINAQPGLGFALFFSDTSPSTITNTGTYPNAAPLAASLIGQYGQTSIDYVTAGGTVLSAAGITAGDATGRWAVSSGVRYRLSGAGAPTAPTSLSASAATTDAVTLNWSAPASDGGSPVTGYYASLEGVGSSDTGPWTSDLLASTATSQTFTLLNPGGTYNLTVRAVNASGVGASGTITVTLPDAPAPNTITITAPGAQTSTAGTADTLQIVASDDGGATMTYAASSLPAGLSINASTGLITGTPTTASSKTVTVTVTDASGALSSTVFAWTVTAAATVVVAFRIAATPVATAGAATTATITIPPTVAAGDLLLMHIGYDVGSGAALTTPAGWTVIDAQAQATVKLTVLRRVATSTDHGTTVTVTWTAATRGTVTLAAYTGDDNTNSVNAHAAIAETTASTTHSTPTVTTTVARCLLVAAVADKGAPPSSAFTWGAGMTARSNGTQTTNGATSVGTADSGTGVTTGANGPYTATGTLSTSTAVTSLLALTPSPSGGGSTGTTTPGAPTGLSTSSITTSTVTLNWSPPASDGGSTVTGYAASCGTTTTGSLSAVTTSHQFTGLAAGTGYTLKVWAINGYGTGAVASTTATTTAAAAAGVTFGLDFGSNTPEWKAEATGSSTSTAFTDNLLIPRIRTAYGRGLGQHAKFFSGSTGTVRNTITMLSNSGWGNDPSERNPVLCYKGTNSTSDYQFAFQWVVDNLPGQTAYWVYHQEIEGSITPAQLATEMQAAHSVRAQNSTWVTRNKLAPCLKGYKEVDNPTTGQTWQNYVQPLAAAGTIDLVGWDVYDMDFYAPTWSPSTYFAPMITGHQTMGIPCAVMEWGTTISRTQTPPSYPARENEASRAARTQSVIDFLNSYAYNAITRPWGVQWANYWENWKGEPGNATYCATGFTAEVEGGTQSATFTVIKNSLT